MTSSDISPEHADALRSWRRTGLVTGYAAVLCLGASVVWRLVGPNGSTGVVVLNVARAGGSELPALVEWSTVLLSAVAGVGFLAVLVVAGRAVNRP